MPPRWHTRCEPLRVCHRGGMADEVTIKEDGPLLLIGVNRPDAHNLWNLEVIQAVCRACKRLADAEHLRAGVIFGHGRLFTAGLDLASVGPPVATGGSSPGVPAERTDLSDCFRQACPQPSGPSPLSCS